jgi:transmembrane sensor
MSTDDTLPRDRIHADLLDRYLAGVATPEERERVERWTHAHPSRAELLESLQAESTPAATTSHTDAAWTRLAGKLSAAPRRSFVQPAWLRLAAVLVVALGVFSIWRAMAGPGGAPSTEVALVEYAAPIGSTSEVRLADGSEVTLAPGSRLLVPEDLSGARDVTLEGEAFFRVTHDAARPFRVLSGGSAARVLGTEFDVRTGSGDEVLRVAVATGRVGVGREDRDPAAVLEPGQMAVLDAAGNAQVGPADLDRILAWTRGRIEMDGLTLSDALLELERWYDVDLEVADPDLAARRVTASFRGEPIEQVLESLTLALSARHERDGRVYRVLPGSAPR